VGSQSRAEAGNRPNTHEEHTYTGRGAKAPATHLLLIKSGSTAEKKDLPRGGKRGKKQRERESPSRDEHEEARSEAASSEPIPTHEAAAAASPPRRAPSSSPCREALRRPCEQRGSAILPRPVPDSVPPIPDCSEVSSIPAVSRVRFGPLRCAVVVAGDPGCASSRRGRDHASIALGFGRLIQFRLARSLPLRLIRDSSHRLRRGSLISRRLARRQWR
jgi:hypothetical protein